MFKSLLSLTFLKNWRAKRRAALVARQEVLQAAKVTKHVAGTVHTFGPQVSMRLLRKERARQRNVAEVPMGMD